MESIAIAAVLGLVEGLTEFLPVSSTGHLIVAGHLLGMEGETANLFEIFIQLGAVLAVVFEYRRTLWSAASGALSPGSDRRFVGGLALAFLPAAVIGLAMHGWIERHLFSPRVVAAALVVGGVGILAIEAWLRGRGGRGLVGRYEDARDIPARAAFWIGLSQVLALCPGVSRAAATILGGLVVGLTRRAATEFSFFLAIPTLGAACLFSLRKAAPHMSGNDALVFATGFVVSFVVALAVIRIFLAWVRTRDFRPFAWYRIGFGLLVLWLMGGAAPRG